MKAIFVLKGWWRAS
ncbi:trp operon leader peptide [Escherichia coli]